MGETGLLFCGVLVLVVVFMENFSLFALSAGLTDLRISILKRHWISILEF